MRISEVRRLAAALGAVAAATAAGGLWLTLNDHPAPPRWPDRSVQLSAPPCAPPEGAPRRRILLDAGHGAPGNPGNKSALCRDEQDFTLDLAEQVAAVLEGSGGFQVRLSRQPGQLVDYRQRVHNADAWRAEAFVSLHSDVRGASQPWHPRKGKTCLRSHTAPGFSVLWSDEGPSELLALRRHLARAVAGRLAAARLPAYDGVDYGGDYAADADRPGVFIDRHPASKRIYLLYAPRVPSIIVETHNARDEREARRWQEPATRTAFAQALCAALLDALPPPTE